MTLPERFFCSSEAVQGRAIHMGRPFTLKRTSTASAWRVAIATMLAFHEQCRSSPLQRSVTWKSSYMQLAYLPWSPATSAGVTFGGRCCFRADKLVGLQWLCPHLYGPACKLIDAKDKTPVDTQTRHALKG